MSSLCRCPPYFALSTLLLKDIVHFTLYRTHPKSSLVPPLTELADPSECLKQRFITMHLTCRDSVVTSKLLSVPNVDGDSKSYPGSKMCPCCSGYHPAVLAAGSGWLQYPWCWFWKEDPAISDHWFQTLFLKSHLSTARSLPERLRNSLARGNQDSEVRSHSPEKQKEKILHVVMGSWEKSLHDGWSGEGWMCRRALHLLVFPLAAPASSATGPSAV